MNRTDEWLDFWQHHLPADTTVVIENNSGEEFSGEIIWKASDAIVTSLKKMGCSPGTIVSTTNTGFLLFRDMLAAAQCGAILHPTTPGLQALARVRHSLLIQQDTITEILAPADTEIPADTVLLLNTSGTSTKIPARIPLTGSGLIAQLVNHGAVFSAEWERKRLSVLPQHHAFGLVLDLFLGVYMRQRVLCSPDLARSPQGLLNTLDQKKIGMLALVPRVLELLSRKGSQHPNGFTAISDLHIHTGGAPIRSQLQDELKQRIRRLTIGYGLTEAGPGVLIDGIPIGYETRLTALNAEQSTSLLSTESPREGTLWIRGPSLSPAVSTDSDGYFCTNDLAICVENRIEVIGRAGPTIKDLNGTWIPLSSIEHDLLQFPDVLSARVYADQATLKVYLITNRGTPYQSELRRIIVQALKKRTMRETEVFCQPFTHEHEADLTRANSKGLESLLP